MLAGNQDQVGDGRIQVIENRLQAQALCSWLRRQRPLCGLDCETTGCNPKEMAPARGPGEIVCWSLAYVPERPSAWHSVTGNALATRVFLWAEVLPWLAPWLEDPGCPKVWHNGTTYDYHMFQNHGITVRGALWDTLRMSKLRNPSTKIKHDLKALMWWRLGYRLGSYKKLFSRPGLTSMQTLPAYPGKPDNGQLSLLGGQRPKLVKRKVGEWENVPTLWVEGAEIARISWSDARRVLIPLETVRTEYPRLLPLVYDYATLDAKATVELQPLLLEDLEGLPWKWGA